MKKNYDGILDVSAIVLANLCVSYIMTSQNEQAEDLMRKIEKEVENLSYDFPEKRCTICASSTWLLELCIAQRVTLSLVCLV